MLTNLLKDQVPKGKYLAPPKVLSGCSNFEELFFGASEEFAGQKFQPAVGYRLGCDRKVLLQTWISPQFFLCFLLHFGLRKSNVFV